MSKSRTLINQHEAANKESLAGDIAWVLKKNKAALPELKKKFKFIPDSIDWRDYEKLSDKELKQVWDYLKAEKLV